MIIFGSRMYGKKNVVRSFGECPNCNRFVEQTSYNGRRFGHVYFIPLFPVAGQMRVLKECAKCKNGQHLPIDAAEQIYRRIESLMPACVAAAADHQRAFPDPDPNESEPIHTGPSPPTPSTSSTPPGTATTSQA